ncbi:MAG TPA: hypothetical protein VKU39_06375 [Streptosporangiaceae bacterium]|nr:hypothetical protein [Streptosporangiaceae bacterium]
MSVPARVAALLAAVAAAVAGIVFVSVYYIGDASSLPVIHYAATNGVVNVVLQEDPKSGEATVPDWVTYYAQDPGTQKWLHTTLFSVPANTKVKVTIYGYDGCTPLRNNFYSQVLGTDGGTVGVRQYDKNNKPIGGAQTVSVINSWADCNVAHTFAIPGIGLYVPVASPNADNSKNNLCATGPCTPDMGVAYSVETFSFTSPSKPGVFRWQCLVPCGGGYVDGNSGPMQTLGWMAGEMTVLAS